MELWYSIVIGTVIYLYIHSYNYTAKLYLESDKTLTLMDVYSIVTNLGFSS